MSEDEADRMRVRVSNMDIFKSTQLAKKHFGVEDKKLTHECYILPIGRIPNFNQQPSCTDFESDIVEDYLGSVVLYQNATQLAEKRKEYAVIEDDFSQTLERMLQTGKTLSFKNLVGACRKFERSNYIQLHYDKSQESFNYFTNKGVDEDNAQAYAFAIAFYTGAYSWMLSIEANLVARRTQIETLTNMDVVKVDDDAAMIMYYLIKGLSHIQFYWGVVKRYVKLSDEELADYKPGELVTWLQFSSADKRDKPPDWFKGRNAVFTIFSLTGRSIRYFSNCADEEDEVLFLPHSCFLVCRTKYDLLSRKHHIHLRQVNTSRRSSN